MGSQQSTQLTLAEKRYRIGSPERAKKRKNPPKPKKKPAIESTKGALTTEAGLSLPTNGKIKIKSNSNHTLSRSNTIDSHGASSRSSSDLNSLSLSNYSMNGSNNNELLTRTQRLLVENSWKRSRKSGADNVGTKIFLLVLTAQPDIKEIWGLEKVPQGRLKYDPRFRKHALVFNRTFDYIVKNLNYTEKLVQHFQALGKKHVMFQGRGFLPSYWDTFTECMTKTAIEWDGEKGGQRCRDTMVAWRILVSFIIKQMRIGFDEEKQNRRKFTTLSSIGPSVSTTSYYSPMRCPMGSSSGELYSSPCSSSLSVEHCLKGAKRAESQQFLRPAREYLEHKLSFQEGRQNHARLYENYCVMDEQEDEEHSECSFYTPPSTKRNMKMSASFSGLSLKDTSDTDVDDEEVWASPRKHFPLSTGHLIDA